MTAEAFTTPYTGRTIANRVDVLEQVEAWLPAAVCRVYAVLDNLSTHRALDVVRFSLGHPRWECVFQPTSAASLNPTPPWWKTLRSLAPAGKRFANWEESEAAIADATTYGNAPRHPHVWGRRRRHHSARQAGLILLPKVA